MQSLWYVEKALCFHMSCGIIRRWLIDILLSFEFLFMAPCHVFSFLFLTFMHVACTTLNHQYILLSFKRKCLVLQCMFLEFWMQIGQHFKDGYLHKDEFKIVYVAPMKVEPTHSSFCPLKKKRKKKTGFGQLFFLICWRRGGLMVVVIAYYSAL